MCICSFLLCIAVLPFLVKSGFSAYDIFMKQYELLSISVPGILPAALVIGASFSNKRLKAKGIISTNTEKINNAGILDIFVFDKTGTLTSNEIKLDGYIWVKQKH